MTTDCNIYKFCVLISGGSDFDVFCAEKGEESDDVFLSLLSGKSPFVVCCRE